MGASSVLWPLFILAMVSAAFGMTYAMRSSVPEWRRDYFFIMDNLHRGEAWIRMALERRGHDQKKIDFLLDAVKQGDHKYFRHIHATIFN